MIGHKQKPNDEGNVDRLVRTILLNQTLHICLHPINLKDEIERELGKTFHNLCALNRHDCHVYTEMSSLANERFGLKIPDTYFPGGTFDQRFDLKGILLDLECE